MKGESPLPAASASSLQPVPLQPPSPKPLQVNAPSTPTFSVSRLGSRIRPEIPLLSVEEEEALLSRIQSTALESDVSPSLRRFQRKLLVRKVFPIASSLRFTKWSFSASKSNWTTRIRFRSDYAFSSARDDS